MIHPEFVNRKLQLIADDLGRLIAFKKETLESLTADEVKLAAVERMLERIVLPAVDINEHLISERATGEERTSRLTYRDTFLMLAHLGIYPNEFAERIARSAGLRNILVHDYNDVDRRIVHASIHTCLAGLSPLPRICGGVSEAHCR
ncbi:MAG: type VII toxin-antitoxin system HepT family RNase toxin [Gammaproteobacteria bacterium]